MAIEIRIMSLDLDSDEVTRTVRFNKEEISIGRYETNDLVLDRPEVSGEHVKISLKAGNNGGGSGIFITDLGSSNGTRVEDMILQAFAETPVSLNARIMVGTYLLKARLLSAEEAAEINVQTKPPEEKKNGASFSVPKQDQPFHPSTAADPVPRGGQKIVTKEQRVVTKEDNPTLDGLKNNQILDPVLQPLDSERSHFSGMVEEQDVLDFDLCAMQVFMIYGTVTYWGEPLEGVHVDGGDLGERITDADGTFLFEQVPEDTSFSIRPVKENFSFECSGSSGVLTEDTQLDITAIQHFTISGRVTHKGVPLTGVEIDGGELGKTVTDGDGYYSFKDVPEGTNFEFTASKDGFVFSRSGVVKKA
jgi:pSer/pThr/pTyr-binding forkhead associated (FHA) protein